MRRIDSDNPYEAVAKIIHEYRERHGEHRRSDFAVTLKLGNRITTELFCFYQDDDNGDEEYEWNCDWWEGEKEVYLCGFMPIENMSFFNVDEMTAV